MRYDIRTKETAMAFLEEVTGFSKEEIIAAWDDSDGDFDIFWDIIEEGIVEEEFKDIVIVSFHIVGSLDKCGEIQKNGLRDLQYVLGQNTIMKRLLQKYEISFDLDGKKLIISGTSTSIDLDRLRGQSCLYRDERLYNVALRIYNDPRVNTFMYNDNPEDYGEEVAKRPEFLRTLSEYNRAARPAEQLWKKKSTSYLLTVETGLEGVDASTFDLESMQNMSDVILGLVRRAVERYFYPHDYSCLYFKNGYAVPPNQIVEYKQLG